MDDCFEIAKLGAMFVVLAMFASVAFWLSGFDSDMEEYITSSSAPTANESVGDNAVYSTSFDYGFCDIDNSRIKIDYKELNTIARELYDKYTVQLRVKGVITKESDSNSTYADAKDYWKYKCSEPVYDVLLYITDNGDYWFEGSHVGDFIDTDTMNTYILRVSDCYEINAYSPNRTPAYILCALLTGIALCLIGYRTYNNIAEIRHQKAEDDARILSAELPDYGDALLTKYLSKEEDSK